MEETKELKVHGLWASPFSMRIEIALKLKGIPYEFVEEDLEAKSHLLLQYNPVHKKIPVLVHNGKPINESLIILEYIDDNRKDPPLLPEDFYERAMVRFWANYYDEKQVDLIRCILMTEGEEQEKAFQELVNKLQVFGDGIKHDFPGAKPHFNGESPGFLDIVVGSISCWYRAIEEINGRKLIDREKNPLLHSYLAAFMDLRVVKDTFPCHEKLVAYGKGMRPRALERSRT